MEVGSFSSAEAEGLIRASCPNLSGWAVREVAEVAASAPYGRARLERLLWQASRAHVESPEAYLLGGIRQLARELEERC